MKRNFKKLLFVLILLCAFFLIGCDEEKNNETMLEEAFAEIVEDIDITGITEDINLPITYENISIVWYSDNINVITNEGVVTRQNEDVIVKLSATLTLDDITKVFEISVKVVAIDNPITYAVLLPREDNGIVEVSKIADITAGEIITIRLSANQGYELEWLKVNGEIVAVSNNEVSITVNSNIELEVSFKLIIVPQPNIYTVSFDNNDGSDIYAVDIFENSKVSKPDDPEREGYTFLGWYLGEEEFDFENDTMPAEDITLVAKWEENVNPTPITYTVTFDSNGGNAINNQTVNENEKAVKPSDPTKEGYVFSAWLLDGVEFDFNTPITEDITLVAYYIKNSGDNTNPTPDTYTITLPSDANGKVTASKTTDITAGEKVVLTVTPNTGYELEWLKVNDEEVNVLNGKATITINSNVNIVVSFVETNQGDNDNTQTTISYTSTFKDQNLSVGSGELEYTASRNAFGWDTSGRGVQFTQNDGPVTITSKVSLTGVNSVTVKVASNNPTGMEVSIKVGSASLTCEGQTKVTVNKNSGIVDLTFTGNNLTGNISVLLTNLASKNSMYILSISINGTGTGESGSTDEDNTGTTDITTEQKLVNIKNDLSSILNLANTKLTGNISFPTTSLYDSVIVWNTSNSSLVSLDGKVNTSISEKTQVTLGYQIILEGVEYDFVYFNVYVGGKTTYISYYESIDGLTGSSLFSALRNLITSTHKKITTYAELKTYLQEADEDPNNPNNMLLFYTGKSIKKTADMDVWNREHVWPQSKGWFKTSGAGADMHHLRPCNPQVNGSRGSILFGESSSYYNAGEHGADYRGDCARIILYMFTRYSQADSYSWTSIFQSYEILYKWHIEDPVSETEIIRNEYTVTIQGNRNPFIDYPEFANMIWGTKGTKLANNLFTGTKADKLNEFAESFGEETYF